MEQTKNQAPTYESVWALMQENAQQMRESNAKFDHEMAKSRTDWEKAMAESNAKWEKRMEKLDEQIGGISKSNGD
ncbi:MAG: hypothetical protein LBC84_04715, partial [Prevotellaceae bacterium]|nr:hypothetical protein [Prevotellaceae bacterium]